MFPMTTSFYGLMLTAFVLVLCAIENKCNERKNHKNAHSKSLSEMSYPFIRKRYRNWLQNENKRGQIYRLGTASIKHSAMWNVKIIYDR